MDLSFTPEQQAFREEVREWIARAMPADMRRKAEAGASFHQEETMQWHRILYEKGWIAPHWPKEVGGTGWDVARRFIFQEEIVRANAPELSPFGLSMVGPLLIQFGSSDLFDKRQHTTSGLETPRGDLLERSEPRALAHVERRPGPRLQEDVLHLVDVMQRVGDLRVTRSRRCGEHGAPHRGIGPCHVPGHLTHLRHERVRLVSHGRLHSAHVTQKACG